MTSCDAPLFGIGYRFVMKGDTPLRSMRSYTTRLKRCSCNFYPSRGDAYFKRSLMKSCYNEFKEWEVTQWRQI